MANGVNSRKLKRAIARVLQDGSKTGKRKVVNEQANTELPYRPSSNRY